MRLCVTTCVRGCDNTCVAICVRLHGYVCFVDCCMDACRIMKTCTSCANDEVLCSEWGVAASPAEEQVAG